MLKYLGTFLLGVLTLATITPLIKDFISVKPYHSVKIVEESWLESGLVLRATFVKNGECELSTFKVVGISEGVPKYLKVNDLDGLPDNYDREDGSQGLNIIVDTTESTYEAVELRTRHKCYKGSGKEKTVARVFHYAKNPDLY